MKNAIFQPFLIFDPFWGGDKGGRNWAVTKNHKESFFFFVILCDRS